jgi:hypothetical protein
MMVVPAEAPVTIPVVPIVATVVVPLLQVPPEVPSLKVVVAPEQIPVPPVMAAGAGLTVNPVVVRQIPNENVIVVLPTKSPFTTPVVEPIVATVVLLLVQLPPPMPSPSVVELPTHTLGAPVMAVGVGLTVTAAVEKHPSAIL